MITRVVVVDDEELGRRGVTSRLSRRSDVEVVAECANGREAVSEIRRLRPDLVFLDVQMPEMDGLSVAREIGSHCRHVIFVTAYDRHAVDAFEVHALDYLLKPIDDVRFDDAVNRAIATDSTGLAERVAAVVVDTITKNARASRSDRYAVRDNGRILLVRHADIDRVEAEEGYIRIHVGPQSWLVRDTMNAVARDLGSRRFLRIHRSTIVNVDCVQELRSFENGDYAVFLRDGTELRLSRRYRDAVNRLTGG